MTRKGNKTNACDCTDYDQKHCVDVPDPFHLQLLMLLTVQFSSIQKNHLSSRIRNTKKLCAPSGVQCFMQCCASLKITGQQTGI